MLTEIYELILGHNAAPQALQSLKARIMQAGQQNSDLAAQGIATGLDFDALNIAEVFVRNLRELME